MQVAVPCLLARLRLEAPRQTFPLCRASAGVRARARGFFVMTAEETLRAGCLASLEPGGACDHAAEAAE